MQNKRKVVVVDGVEMRSCKICGCMKPLPDFCTIQGKYQHPYCNVCKAAYARQLYRDNINKRAYHIAYEANKRAKKFGTSGVVTREQVLTLLTSPECYYCKYPNDGTLGMHLEHVEPLSQGGSNDLSNIVPACEICNFGKGKLSIEIFTQWLYSVKDRLT